MVSTGIRKRRSVNDKMRDTVDKQDDEYIQRARKGTVDSSPITGNAGKPSISGSATPGPSTLDPAGGAMLGTLAYNPLTVGIKDGRINIQPSQSGASKASSYMLVTAQGTPDDLFFIDGADKNGQILDLQGTISQVINIKHADIGSITNIVGLGTVTVTTFIPHNITTGQKGNILGTTNFNVTDVVFTKTGASTFTYPATGSATAETAGIFQRGNILTPDGADIVLDGTQFANAVPWVSLRFDPTVVGFGAWRAELVGGDSGLTEPVIFGINTLTGQTLPTKTSIAWNTKNPHQITLTKAVEFEFTSLPASGSYEGILVIIDIDSTGGFASPIWPTSLVNPPTIPTTANSRFSVMLYTIDGGTSVTHATSVGSSSSGSGFSGNLSDLVINTTKNWAAQGISNFGNLTGVTGIDLDGSSATIQGTKLLDLIQANQKIDSLSTGIEYSVGNLQSHLFKSISDNIAKFEESASGVFRLDMLDHSIKDAKDITFTTGIASALAGAVPGIAFNNATTPVKQLRINVPTGGEVIITENNAVGSISLKKGAINVDIVDTKFLSIDPSSTEPTVVGLFRTVGSDVFVFSGGSSRNFSDIPIGTPANTALSNLTTTAINAALVPATTDTLDLGSSSKAWRIIHGKQLEIITASTAPNASSDTQLSRNETGTGTTKVNHFNFNVKKESASTLPGSFDFTFDGASTVQIKKDGTITLVDVNAVNLSSHIQLNSQSSVPAVNGRISLGSTGILVLHANAFEIRRSTTGVLFNQFNIVKIDPSPGNGEPIADINFQLFDDPVTITYTTLQGKIVDATDAGSLIVKLRANNSLQDMITMAGRKGTNKMDMLFRSGTILKASSGKIGYYVTNEPTNLESNGSEGTIQIPRFSNSNPSAADLNALLGSKLGSCGFNISTSGTNSRFRFYVKQTLTGSNGGWAAFDADSATVI